VVSLISKRATGEALPFEYGGAVLEEIAVAGLTSIAIERGKEKIVSTALKNVAGLGFPAPNRATSGEGGRCIWTGPGQALLVGMPLSKLNGSAISDQSDGWAVLRLQGEISEAVLARLVPIDVRISVFKTGHAAKTLLYHMPLLITCRAKKNFDLFVFRSMAQTAVHEIKVAIKSVAAQLSRI